MGGDLGENGYMYIIAETLRYSPETITVLLISYVKAAQSCPALCDPMDYTVHGIP